MRVSEFLFESQQATAEQVWQYVKKIHPEEQQGGGFLKNLILRYPAYELREVPLSSLHIPDLPPDDQTEYVPADDVYGRGLDIDAEHAGEYSQYYVDRNPIVVDPQGHILDGNHRAWAAAELLNRNTINAWVAQQTITELGGRGELKVFKRIQNYFFKRGYGYAGEGRDQMAFESPRGTVVKVLGIGNPEREKIVRDYVRFFEQNQQDPYIPKIYSSGEFTVSGKTYFVYEMEYLNYIANEDETLDYIEKLMSATARGRHQEFMASRPVPPELDKDDIPGLIKATLKLERALGGQAPLDLSMIENLRRRDDGQIVIMDPYSL